MEEDIEQLRHIRKHLRNFVALSIFSLPFTVRVFSKTLIVDLVVFSQTVMEYHFWLAEHIENGISILLEISQLNFSFNSIYIPIKLL